MKLSVVIPCYNEVNTIESIVRAVRDSPYSDKEIIVVDDCSRDGSRVKLKEMSDLIDKVIFHEQNQGKGGALHTGIRAATGDLVIIQDADNEYDPNEYPKLVQPFLDGRADVVYGSRYLLDSPRRVIRFWHTQGNRLLTLISNFFTDLNLTDMETCYKVFRREIIQSLDLKEKRFGFEPEVTAKIAKGRYRLYEVAISYHGRSHDEGKKIGWKDGFRAVYCILKYNLLR